MGATDKYCLRWNDYRSNISSAFQDLRASADFFDVTLATEEIELKAHRVILSACSPQLRDLLKRHSSPPTQHLLIYLRGVRQSDLEAILEFMYNGEVNVCQEDLNSFLAVAEDLKVKGLTQNLGGSNNGHSSTQDMTPRSTSSTPTARVKNSTPMLMAKVSSGTSKNGSSLTPIQQQPAVKRIKTDPTVMIKVKEEAGAAKQKVFTQPEVSYMAEDDAANEANTNQKEETGFGGPDDGNEMYFDENEEYGSESGELSGIVVDPSTMGMPGSSLDAGSKEEQDYLTSEIGDYLTSMSARREDGHYQCLVCARTSRDLYNQRQHIMTHMMKDTEFLERLDHFVKSHSIQQNTNSFSCLLCRMVIEKGYYMVRQHFLSKHLKEDKSFSEPY